MLSSNADNYPLCRHHHSANHDHTQHHCQEVPASGILRHCHGPLCDRVLLVCLRCTDGVRHPQLLLQLSQANHQEEEDIGEWLGSPRFSQMWQGAVYGKCVLKCCYVLKDLRNRDKITDGAIRWRCLSLLQCQCLLLTGLGVGLPSRLQSSVATFQLCFLFFFSLQLLHPDSTRWIPDRISLQAPSVCTDLQMPIFLGIMTKLSLH